MSNEQAAAKPNRWELRACGRRGHATYRPDEAELADRLRIDTALGPAWRCLRCGNFIPGPPADGGASDSAPLVLRGKALRQATILRLLAIERLIRAILFGVAVWAVLKFRNAHDSIQTAVDRDLPAFRAVGIHVDQLALVKDLQKALDQAPGRLTLVALLLAAYAAVELVEGAGLWLLKRWGEYFAVVATSIFLPLEVLDLLQGVTFTRAGTLIINLAAVVYLLLSKHLFGLRGGRSSLRPGTPRRPAPGDRTGRNPDRRRHRPVTDRHQSPVPPVPPPAPVDHAGTFLTSRVLFDRPHVATLPSSAYHRTVMRRHATSGSRQQAVG